MFPIGLFTSRLSEKSRKKKEGFTLRCSFPFNTRDPGRINGKKTREVASKASHFLSLTKRVGSICLLHPLGLNGIKIDVEGEDTEGDEDEQEPYDFAKRDQHAGGGSGGGGFRQKHDVAVAEEVVEAVGEVKRAYVGMQEAQCTWDSDKMRAADAAVVAALRRLVELRERFKRGVAAEVEMEMKGPKRKVCCSLGQVPMSPPSPDLFEATMSVVTRASNSFTTLLLSLMCAARWDIPAVIRSIEGTTINTTTTSPHHAKYALESYISRKIFQGFNHETFYMDRSVFSLLNAKQFRQDCFSKYRDMKSMDPTELLGVLPSCQFGVFCAKKYLSMFHPKMEESLFGDLEQRRLVLGGSHPRTPFYSEFLGLAKAIWLLHLLAFSLEQPPSHFEASRGVRFHPVYMESVVGYPGRKVPSGQAVKFTVTPGFKLGNGSVVRTRVFLGVQ